MLWNVLRLTSGSESPVVVVLSGSMEPAFERGDILFLWRCDEPYRVGDIAVFKIDNRAIPIVHRILEVREQSDGTALLLTKGDNNPGNDRWGVYDNGVSWVHQKDIVGRVRAILPRIGFLTIVFTENPLVVCLTVGIIVMSSAIGGSRVVHLRH